MTGGVCDWDAAVCCEGLWRDAAMLFLWVLNSLGRFWLRPLGCLRSEREAEEFRDAAPIVRRVAELYEAVRAGSMDSGGSSSLRRPSSLEVKPRPHDVHY